MSNRKAKKQPYRPGSLFWRFSLVFLFILAVIGLAYVYITIHFSSLYFQMVNQRLNRAVATNITGNASPFLNNKVNQPGLEKIFGNVMAVNPSLEVYLLDTAGNILSFYAPEKKIILKKVNLVPVHRFISTNGSEHITGDDPRHPGVQKVFSVAPVMSGGLVSGYLYVVLASEEYDAVSRFLLANYLMKVGSGTMIFTLLATFIFGLIVIRIVTRNISGIIDVMEKFRAGDLTARLNVKTKGEIKQLADIFNEMADILTRNIEKLKEVEVLRRELIANVSHDLRTPIAVIHGYVETLQMKEDSLTPSERKRYMNTIVEATAKLERLVNELFELSKLEANQVRPQKEPFFISELVNDMTNKYHLIAKQNHILIDTLLAKDLPPVYADISLIERVIQNLLDNAIRFTPAGGKVLIQTINNNGTVEVTVADSGVGIADDDREKVFGRYFKADVPGNYQNSTGLGLAIVKKILDLHECALFINPNIPAGVSFVFHLPLYKASS